MNEQELREQIAEEIEKFANKGYQGAVRNDDPNILAIATYIKEALMHAAAIAKGQK
jgi:hypothetical protein